mmetsp:Transcript_3981/g.7753  ORF Transcript_3981/g.7753 Transcript_3981/m.7753 type:complete len:781 (-) Transcript_3981:501-2843(-)
MSELLHVPAQPLGRSRLKRGWRTLQRNSLHGLGANGRVRAHHHALVALDANVLLPHGDGLRGADLVPSRRAGWVGAVFGEHAHGQGVALVEDDGLRHPRHERVERHLAPRVALEVLQPLHQSRAGGGSLSVRHLDQVVQSHLDCLEVLLHHVLALPRVRLHHRRTNRSQRLLPRHDPREVKEARLHDRVDAAAHARVARHLHGVDGVHCNTLLQHPLLHLGRERVPELLRGHGRVEQKSSSGGEHANHVHGVHQVGEVAAHKLSRAWRNQVRRINRLLAKAQVGRGDAASLLGVVVKVSLDVQRRLLAHDLARVLRRPHRAVAAHAVEQAPPHALRLQQEARVVRDAGEADVVHNAHSHVPAGLCGRELLKDALGHGGGEVLPAQAVARAHNPRRRAPGGVAVLLRVVLLGPLLVQRRHHVAVHRLAGGARLLGLFEDHDAFHRRGQRLYHLLRGERAEQTNLQQPHLASLVLVEVVHHCLQGAAGSSHGHGDVLRAWVAHVLHQLVEAARARGKRVHALLHRVRHRGHEGVHRLAPLEVYVRVLRRAPHHRPGRAERALAVSEHEVLRHQRPQVLVLQPLNLLHLVGCAESVKEVHKRHARAQRRRVRHQGQVLGLLHVGGGEHGKAGGPDSHDVRVVPKDGEPLRGERARGDVHHKRKQLPRNLVHLGDHQQQPLRRGEGGGQRAGLQRAVHRACCPGLALELHHTRHRAPQVGTSLGGPEVRRLAHWGGRGDGVDGHHLGQLVRDVGGGVAPVAHLHAPRGGGGIRGGGEGGGVSQS